MTVFPYEICREHTDSAAGSKAIFGKFANLQQYIVVKLQISKSYSRPNSPMAILKTRLYG
ncbi:MULTISPECIES: hypothetical protein [unclassified Ruegeria]|uniref:hypothetical protein n=1 Tax=unclassified Ruegeria TaxID=2625375 RepID=UPI001487A056|nr:MULTISPECIES: hypothetical protein [unclassified Ruegeria]